MCFKITNCIKITKRNAIKITKCDKYNLNDNTSFYEVFIYFYVQIVNITNI